MANVEECDEVLMWRGERDLRGEGLDGRGEGRDLRGGGLEGG